MDNNARNVLGVTITLLTGLIVGAIVGMLFAPKSGKEIRKVITDKSEKIYESGKEGILEAVKTTKDFTKDAVETGKQKFAELKTAVM